MQIRVSACAAACAATESPRFALAELNFLLSGLTAGELREAVAALPPPGLTLFLANYIAAMVEYACAKRSIPVPAWTRSRSCYRARPDATSAGFLFARSTQPRM
jgi:hypothetical protein